MFNIIHKFDRKDVDENGNAKYYTGINFWKDNIAIGAIIKIPLLLIWGKRYLMITIYLDWLRGIKKLSFDYIVYWKEFKENRIYEM